MSTTENPEYAVGDETSVSGTVVRVENIGGNYQYTVAVQTEGNNRPVSTPALHYVAPEAKEEESKDKEDPKAKVKAEEETKPATKPATHSATRQTK